MFSNKQADCRGSETLQNIDHDRSRSTLIEGSKRDWLRLRIAVIGATCIIVASIALFYALVGHDGLPIGWDTPHYIGGAVIFASQGPIALLSWQGPYDVLYQILEGTLVWARIPGTTVEIFLPVILAGSIPYLMSKLALGHLNGRTAIFVALATPGWYTVYRLQADLHANLLALTLFLSALVFLSRAKSLRDRSCLYGLGLVGLSSFAHIESTLFLVLVTFVSSLTKLRPYPFRVAIVPVATSFPATVFYVAHLLLILNLSGGSLDFTNAQSIESWLFILGPLLPLMVIGFVVSGLRRRSWLEVFALVWGISSIIAGLTQYVSPQTVIFSQRAILLIPTPLLAGLGASRLGQFVESLKTTRIPLRYVRIGTIVAIFTILALSWPIASATAIPNEKIFLTSAQYQHLQWVAANLKFSSTPIFMFNDVNEFASGLGQLYNNWVSATVGPHLSYLGLIDYLAQFEETPFSETGARTISALFMQQILSAGISTRSELLQHPIIIMADFYRPFPFPNYTSPLFTEVTPGVYIDNASSLESLGNVTLPLYATFANHSGSWYGVQRSWTKSLSAYEVYDDSVPMNIEASFQLEVQFSGNYTLGLRYWDGLANHLIVSVDGSSIGIITYGNTKHPIIRDFQGIVLSHGIHTLTIGIDNTPSVLNGGLDYASLDYVVLTKT